MLTVLSSIMNCLINIATVRLGLGSVFETFVGTNIIIYICFDIMVKGINFICSNSFSSMV